MLILEIIINRFPHHLLFNNNNNNNNNTFIYIALFLFLTNSALQDIYNLTSHRIINKGCETGPPVYRPYPRRFCRF